MLGLRSVTRKFVSGEVSVVEISLSVRDQVRLTSTKGVKGGSRSGLQNV